MPRVAVFGLSGNPPTHLGGHAGVVRGVAPLVDEVWVLPVYRHAYASKRDLVAFEHRLRMCELGLRDAAPNVRVLDMELALFESASQAVHIGSVDVLYALRRDHPGVQFSWVLGADTFADLRTGKWKESARFMAGAHILVVGRAGAPAPELTGCNATLVTVPGLDGTSSTAVRAALAAGDGDSALASMVHPEVHRYIIEHRLYTDGVALGPPVG